VPASDFLERVCQDGIHLCNLVLGVTVADEIVPGLGYTSWDNGFPDVHIFPDLTTFAPIPWAEGTATVICDLTEADGTPTAVSPRQVLRAVLARVQERGFEPRIGYELEFYLFRNSWESARENGFAGLTPLFADLRTYSLAHLGRLDPVVGGIVRQLAAIGIPVEAATTEYSPGQFELNLRYTGALAAADQVVRFKSGVREIAETHHCVATFMAKYDATSGGSSGHIHQSLWSADGQSAFAGPDGGLSDIAHHYLAGLIATMADFTALFCPTVNSYKRTTPYSVAPTTATWGCDNRTTGLRTLTGKPSATRIEHRRPGADANPYLAIAACLAGGLYGIEHELEPPPPVAGNAYELPAEENLLLPATLEDAVARLDGSKLARELLGEAFIEHFLTTRRAEIAASRTAVTDWERTRYFDLI
jgi:glutamine synthetase